MAGIKDFKKVANAKEEVSMLQERLQEFFQPIIQNPLMDGALLSNVSLSTSVSKVEHGLRREILGWIIVSKSADANVWQSSSDVPKSFLNLQASAPVTVSIWVF